MRFDLKTQTLFATAILWIVVCGVASTPSAHSTLHDHYSSSAVDSREWRVGYPAPQSFLLLVDYHELNRRFTGGEQELPGQIAVLPGVVDSATNTVLQESLRWISGPGRAVAIAIEIAIRNRERRKELQR